MQDKITIADAPDCLNTNDKAMWVLGYEAAIEARGQCLHQIQEPAAAEQAAWHAGLDEGRVQAAPAAVAVPDAARDAEKLLRAEAARLERIYSGHGNKWYGFSNEKAAHIEHLRVADALAATSAAAPAAVAGSAPCTFMTEDRAREWAWNKVREEVGTNGWTAGDSSNFYGFYLWGWNYRAQYELQRTATRSAVIQEILSAAPATAAPVVLPEPALHVSGGQLERHCDPEDKNGGRYIPARKTAAGLFTTPLYTEQQVRALLAQAATAAAPAHPAEGEQTDLHAAIMNIPVNKAKLEHLGINERLQYKIGHRDARHDAAELALAHAAPQAQKGQA